MKTRRFIGFAAVLLVPALALAAAKSINRENVEAALTSGVAPNRTIE